MAKVGILTFQNTLNYGATLQCFALYRMLERLGHEPVVIDYRNPQIARNEGLTFSLKRPKSVLAYVKRQRRVRAFDGLKRQMLFTEACGRRDISKVCEGLDCIVVGSDQVWNPKCMGDDPTYFLDFIDNPVKKKSYAASIGGSSIVTSAFDYKGMLNDFSSLLLRERSGSDYVATIVDGAVKPQTVLDPTLLLTGREWASLEKVPEEVGDEDYTLLYAVSEKERSVAAVNSLSTLYGGRKVELASGERAPLPGMEDSTFLQFSKPEEFLGLFSHARHAVVSSFHGVCFCVLNHLDFYYSLPFFFFFNTNNRVLDLVNMLGIQNRTVGDLACGQMRPIDWQNVDSRLMHMREESIKALERSLSYL